MARPSNSQPSSQELLERGRLTLQAIEYHERAARYKAAAASLKAAMVQAENGDVENLHKWLESEAYQFNEGIGGKGRRNNEDAEDPISERSSTERSIRIDQPIVMEPLVADAASIGSDASSIRHESVEMESPWARMEKAAIERLANTLSVNPMESESTIATADSKELIDTSSLANALRIAISVTELPKESNHFKDWWKAPHLWVSLMVHLVLVLCLGLFAISVAHEPRLLSIVSATAEAENVLLESPLEMASELESAAEPFQSEPFQSLLLPNVTYLDTDTSLSESPMETSLAVSSSVKSLVSDSVRASVIGSKILNGSEFFGVKATGNTFVYIVDSSPSMRRDGAFEEARKEIVRSLTSLKPMQRYFISFFGKVIDPMVFEIGVVEKFPVCAKPENLAKTIDWISRVQVQKEGLPPNNALSEAISMQPDGIFLLFDGDTKADVAKFLRRVNRSDDILTAGVPKVPIHVIHFFQDEFQKQMRQIAQENGGTYRFVPRPDRPSKSNR